MQVSKLSLPFDCRDTYNGPDYDDDSTNDDSLTKDFEYLTTDLSRAYNSGFISYIFVYTHHTKLVSSHSFFVIFSFYCGIRKSFFRQ